MKILKAGGRESFTNMPLALDWILTKRCNYRCSYCFHYGKGKTTPPQRSFSTLEQLKTAVNNIVSLNRPWYKVVLSGGEPTIHPHVFDLISLLHQELGERLNEVVLITNGSRNQDLYEELADISKTVYINMGISIHTDHVDMNHILELIENLSADVNMNFALMFNPDKREMVHEIYEIMFEARKKFYFTFNVVTLRDGDRVDPRYTPEDFAWQKRAVEQFKELTQSVSKNFPPRRKAKYQNPIIRDVEDNGEMKTINGGNRTLELAGGLLQFKGMYCIGRASVLAIEETGTCRGMVCGDDPLIDVNIYEETNPEIFHDKFIIHSVKCNRRVCGCAANDPIPKFASEEDAKKFVEFAQKRQSLLFDEYLSTTKK